MEDLNYIRKKRNPDNGISLLTVRRRDINANNNNKEKAEVLNIQPFGVVKKTPNCYTELTDVMKSQDYHEVLSIVTCMGVLKKIQKLDISQPAKLFPRVLTEIGAVL